MLDQVRNFAKGTVTTGYNAAATSVALSSGHGDRFPNPDDDGAFNIVWWNATDYADPADDPNVEIVRVTDRIDDTLQITRAQEGTSATAKNTSAKTYQVAMAVTKKTIDDINALVWTTEIPTGTVDDINMAFVFTAKPRGITAAGATYWDGDTVGGTQAWTWNAGTLTATLAFPVGTGNSIRGIM